MAKRDEVLRTAIDLINLVKEKGFELQSNPDLAKKFDQTRDQLIEGYRSLPASDVSWIEQQYSKWFGATIAGDVARVMQEQAKRNAGG